jgi:UDP-N-acetyl-D-mannosaminuronate dehydrogenase
MFQHILFLPYLHYSIYIDKYKNINISENEILRLDLVDEKYVCHNFNNSINLIIAKSIIKKGLKKIGILGLSYKGNLKVSILSPIIPFVRELKKHKLDVRLFDPFFSTAEIKKILDIRSFKFPKDLKIFDCLIISVDHDEFKNNLDKTLRYIKKIRYILDNNGVWEKAKDQLKQYNYHVSGDKDWI